jgi:PAS domain S-box-containing protein
VFNQQFQFMAILDPDGTVLDANDTCFRATGVPREFVLGRLLWDTPCWGRLPAMQERWKRYITEAAQSGGPVRGETEYTLADETVRHATVVVTGVRDEVGQVTSIIVEGHDDTDRKRNEAILGTQKTVLELLVHGAPLPDVLDALCEVIEGQSQDKLIATVLLVDEDGQHLRSVAGRRAPPAYAQAVDGVAIGPCVGSCGTAAYRGEQVVVSDIATDPLWANFRELALGHGLRACWSTPIFSSQGKVLGTFAVYYPSPREPSLEELRLVEILTRTAGVAIEKRRDEQALRDADRRKDEFLATLAHELRNPLSPIRSSLQILKMPRVDAETIKRSRDMMERQVQHLVRLVDDLLDVSRVMRGKIELRKEPVELATLVARAVETAQPLLDTQGHQLNVRLPAESLLLDADPVRLTQVIGNLLTNAAKYTDPNGQIGLTAERDGETAVLRVQDNGIGIAPDMLRHIFALFVQVDHAATRSQGGLGIGLTLVKNLVEMHGGAIEAHSAGLGKGSEFVVRLPILAKRSERESGRDNGELAHVPPPPSGYRVLIVDDNEDAANSLAVLLRLQGHEVGVAYSGMAALEMTKAGAPDVVFLDIGMPGMDGCEVARRLRQQPGLEHVVLVALTGWGQQEDRRRTAAAGFNHHLVKPPEPKALEVLLSDLQKHHA